MAETDIILKKLNQSKKTEKEIEERLKEQHNIDEVWKIIPGFEKYEASNLGRIRNNQYKKLLKLGVKSEYIECGLSNNDNKKITVKVHRIIAQTFIPNINGKPTVNHKDKDKHNNNVTNLEWASYAEQVEHKNTVKSEIKAFKRPNLPELPNEEWKVVPNYEDYQVSNYGRVKYALNKSTNANYRITPGNFKHGGYMGFTVVNNEGKKKTTVHRLVAQAFIPNPENKLYVNHEDGNKQNNNVTNLFWNTHSENMQHAHDTNLNKTKRQIYQLDDDNNIIKLWDSIKNACDTLKLSRDAITKGLAHGHKAVGFYWVHLEKYDVNAPKKIKPDGNMVKICQLDDNNNIIKEWNSITEASIILKISYSKIFRSLKSGNKAGEFNWVYLDENIPQKIKCEKNTTKKVNPQMNTKEIYQMGDKNNLIQKWDTIEKAGENLKINHVLIANGLEKGYKVGGFYWIYL